jgi:hypothetical protein
MNGGGSQLALFQDSWNVFNNMIHTQFDSTQKNNPPVNNNNTPVVNGTESAS